MTTPHQHTAVTLCEFDISLFTGPRLLEGLVNSAVVVVVAVVACGVVVGVFDLFLLFFDVAVVVLLSLSLFFCK